MARRHNHLLRNLLIGSLITLAAMHPTAVSRLANLAVGLLLAITQGAADAAASNPGPAVLLALAAYITHQIRNQPTHAHTRRT
ncbi:hypothetical protein PYK79_49885 [Streptomyces sp. ID05-04B]|uniref:hypothetical protein n=1 Tax=Streptomyces sp. ID05-04B TaxID=3028661 RepID=UPI0029C558AF|nr:hypothetical protein [Streptomyces sp. ID05-04B]MDX5569791.1 hypothetical protein [Streptomyces sp. ID05-04B]